MRARSKFLGAMRVALALVTTVTACAKTPRPVSRAHVAREAIAAATIRNVPDVPAGDSVTFGGRDAVGDDTVFSFADYHMATADIVHLERRTDKLVTVASLVLPVRYKDSVVLHACTLDGTPDPEILAVYPDEVPEPADPSPAVSPTANALLHPRFAWRASRTRKRFETVDPNRVLCSFAEVLD